MRKFAIQSPVLFGARPTPQRRGPTLEEEEAAKRRASATKQAPAPALVPVLGLSLGSLVKLRPLLLVAGFWPPILDVALGLTGTERSAATRPTTSSEAGAGNVSAIVEARARHDRERAISICDSCADLDLSKPTPPQDLYPALAVLLKPLGYSQAQIGEGRKHPNRLPPEARAGVGLHVPVEVVFHIIKKTPDRKPDVPSRSVAA